MHAMFSEYPCTRYYVGFDAKSTAVMKWLLTDRMQDWIFNVFMRLFDDQSEKKVRFDGNSIS